MIEYSHLLSLENDIPRVFGNRLSENEDVAKKITFNYKAYSISLDYFEQCKVLEIDLMCNMDNLGHAFTTLYKIVDERKRLDDRAREVLKKTSFVQCVESLSG